MDWTPHVRAVIERLGEEVTYTPLNGIGIPVTALFLGPYLTVNLGPGAFESNQTEFVVMSADVPNPQRNDTITRGTTVYTVRDVTPDLAAGFTRLPVG